VADENLQKRLRKKYWKSRKKTRKVWLHSPGKLGIGNAKRHWEGRKHVWEERQ
jgi:hypothetical protein